MIGEILAYLKNYFVVETYHGTFTIEDGQEPKGVPFHDGQYYRVIGSIYNDGVWQAGNDTLVSETFTGTVQLLAIPPDLVMLAHEIEEFHNKPENQNTAYTSESWNGYSYTRRTDKNGRPLSWTTLYASRLNRWRKL